MVRGRPRRPGAWRRWVDILLPPLLMLLASAAAAQEVEPVEVFIRDRLVPPAYAAARLDPGPDDAIALALRQFYRTRHFRPLWVDHAGLKPRAVELVRAMRGAGRDGLDPDAYAPPALLRGLRAAHPDRLAAFEITLSDGLLRLARDLRHGRVAPAEAGLERFELPPLALRSVLLRAAVAPSLELLIDRLAPAHAAYRRLRELLADYRDLAAGGGWPVVPPGPALAFGDRGVRVIALRARLRASGDLVLDYGDADHFDAGLELAVRRFQSRHGLPEDGLVGPATRRALNVPVEDRIRGIIVNLERARWLPEQPGHRHLVVNVPGFVVELVEGARTVMSMRAVVGRPDRRTPLFSSAMTYLVVNPDWTVPPRIAAEDLLPRLRAEPAALVEDGFTVLSDWSRQAVEVDPRAIDWSTYGPDHLPFRLRQDPGPKNALGRIKFMLPNPWRIYLHDTPARGLFEQPARAFSSGCIRLERPLALARHLLGEVEATRLQEHLASGRTRDVRLAEPVPVHIVYRTVWIDEAGLAQFRDDLYGWDARLSEALFGTPRPAPALSQKTADGSVFMPDRSPAAARPS